VLQIRNGSPFVAGIALLPNADGIDTLYLAVKGTFTLEAVPRVADEQTPIVAAPKHVDDPESSGVTHAPDLGLSKPSTDVLVVGSAIAPGGRPTRRVDVSVTVGPVQAAALVQGDRVWEDAVVGYRASPPNAFTDIPLVWERSFGGFDETPDGVRTMPENPVGTGFRAKNGTLPIAGLALPNVEDARHLIGTHTDRPTPVGFAPVGAHWEPRRRYAGTYDEAWEADRSPYLPADFDARFLQVAPASLITPTYLTGGEPIELHGVSADGPMRSHVPVAELTTEFVLDGTAHPVRANIDTLVLEPSDRRFSVVWRAEFACDKRALRVKEARVSLGRIR
jgi:hypothetical protein